MLKSRPSCTEYIGITLTLGISGTVGFNNNYDQVSLCNIIIQYYTCMYISYL